MSTSGKKLYSLQIMRGYAAAIVAMCHIWNDGWLPGTLVEVGGSGVDLFFVLSGFIMCLTVRLNMPSRVANAGYFLKKRIVRIFPIYIICALPLIIFNTHAEGIKSAYFYFGNLLLLPSFTDDPAYYYPLGPGWSLTYEMMFYYLFAGFMLFTWRKTRLAVSLTAFLFALVILVRSCGLQGPQLGWVNFSYIIGDTMLINFALGIVIFFIYNRYKDKVSVPVGVSILCLLIGTLISGILIHYKFSRFVSYGIPAFFVTTIFALTNNDTIKGKLLGKAVFVGDASYSIYLTHFYFAFIKPKIMLLGKHIPMDPEIYKNFVGMSLLTFSIVGGCLFYLWVEKPIVDYFAKKMKPLKHFKPAEVPVKK